MLTTAGCGCSHELASPARASLNEPSVKGELEISNWLVLACAGKADLGLEVGNRSFLTHPAHKLRPPVRLDVKLRVQVLQNGHQFLRRFVSINLRQSGVCLNPPPFQRCPKNPLHCVLESAPVTIDGDGVHVHGSTAFPRTCFHTLLARAIKHERAGIAERNGVCSLHIRKLVHFLVGAARIECSTTRPDTRKVLRIQPPQPCQRQLMSYTFSSTKPTQNSECFRLFASPSFPSLTPRRRAFFCSSQPKLHRHTTQGL